MTIIRYSKSYRYEQHRRPVSRGALGRVVGAEEDAPGEDEGGMPYVGIEDLFDTRVEGEDAWSPMPDWIGDHG